MTERGTRGRLDPARALDPPREVREIAAKLESAGYETWCVGGAVRDALLGLPHLDWDLATAATPPEVRRLFKRTKPIGEKFGTIGVLDRHGVMHEVTTFRHDVRTDGRHAEVEFGASLDEDLARRDFTINAIAYSPKLERLHDPFGGREDLSRGVVRAVGTARQRMTEDRLRALRAIRFAGRFSFRLEPATWSAIVESAPFLTRLSRERIKQELEKTMEQVREPSRAIELWRSAGALRELLPVLDAQPRWALAAADCVAIPDRTNSAGRQRRRTLLRLATLFVGLDGAVVRGALRDLRFSNRDVEWLAHLAVSATALRPRLSKAIDGETPASDTELRRWAALAGRVELADVLRVTIATVGAEHSMQGPVARAARSLYRRGIRLAYRDPVEVGDLAIDGEELMRQAGVPRGPAVGAMLRRLRDAVVDDPSINDGTMLIALARRLSTDRAAGGL